MNSIKNILQKKDKNLLSIYFTCGYPKLDDTTKVISALEKSGVDFIEVGLPYSDPLADGPTIQDSSQKALENGINLDLIFEQLMEVKGSNKTPLVLMGYLNPVESFGYDNFAKAANDVGIDGLLTVDLPPEESDQMAQILAKYEVDPIFLLSPTTTPERMKRIVNAGSGYLYYVSLKGVTGSSILNVDEVSKKVAEIRSHTSLPIGVGFGIKDAESASSISAVSDGVIVGSAIVKIIENNIDDTDTILEKIGALLKSMRTAMDA